MTKMIEVMAYEPGHDGRVYRIANERWHVSADALDDEGKPANGQTWWGAVDAAPEPAPKPKDKRPPGAGPVKGSAVGDDAPPGMARQ